MDCILRNEKDTSKSFEGNSSLYSFEKVLNRQQKRDKYKNSTALNVVENTNEVNAAELLQKRCRFHKSCYKKDPETVKARSKSTLYNRRLCIICQKPSWNVHKVRTRNIGRKMSSLSEKVDDELFYMRLNTIASSTDAIANDLVYHNVGFLLREKLSQNSPLLETISTLSDIELINFIELGLTENSKNILDINKLNSIYQVIFHENGTQIKHLASSNCKIHIKELV